MLLWYEAQLRARVGRCAMEPRDGLRREGSEAKGDSTDRGDGAGDSEVGWELWEQARVGLVKGSSLGLSWVRASVAGWGGKAWFST